MDIFPRTEIIHKSHHRPIPENDKSAKKIPDINLMLSFHLVCLLPVDREIDLKRLAAVSGNKRVELIPAKDLLETTGYIRGGCSPVGMKRKFPSYIDSAAQNQIEIAVSAGIRGCQLIVEPQNLLKFLSAKFVEACHE